MTAVSTTDKNKKGRRTTQTQFIGGDTTVTRCLYTFITAWNLLITVLALVFVFHITDWRRLIHEGQAARAEAGAGGS